ncbi:MAG TPA: DoxX family protein, partial [Cyclobacteriaceae bacterium]|nr:DoxX family protein [Cyclobacteriaceae bacterium]
MNSFFSSTPIALTQGIGLVRIIVGALIVYHGQEVFNPELMNGYMTWDTFDKSNARLLVYLGKSSELIAGISLLLGLFTRIGALITVGTLSYIT